MELLYKMVFPMRRVWNGVASRFGFNKSGIVKLQRDVRACEYEDIHIMWEMLKRNETETARSPGNSSKFPRRSNKRQYWNLIEWGRRSPFLCHSY
ncbi:Elongation factor 4 [Quillaja saponaria]|uniref:Elongation factor 4 n=1 Tax=Quillaja saponaria TaxID=32244 RepID=A0AAD7PJU4_QUISA|nr:Elongation factor 4 [Quillaja saponaria]